MTISYKYDIVLIMKLIKSIGTQADTAASVDISKVFGSYFSKDENAEAFIETGIKPILNNLPRKITFADFGGGQGHLAFSVQKFLEENGHLAQAIVVDSNSSFLKEAKKRNLLTKLCNLPDCKLKDLDFIIMRAVLHYNNEKEQQKIMEACFRALKPGGYLVHQNSSGNRENCMLRSAIVNIPELGRAGAGNYHWVSIDEYKKLVKKSGFGKTTLGFAPSNAWGPEEQWDRFNSKKSEKALKNNDKKLLMQIESRKRIFLKKAYALIDRYSEKYGKKYLSIKEKSDGREVIEYQYPIFISKKN